MEFIVHWFTTLNFLLGILLRVLGFLDLLKKKKYDCRYL